MNLNKTHYSCTNHLGNACIKSENYHGPILEKMQGEKYQQYCINCIIPEALEERRQDTLRRSPAHCLLPGKGELTSRPMRGMTVMMTVNMRGHDQQSIR